MYDREMARRRFEYVQNMYPGLGVLLKYTSILRNSNTSLSPPPPHRPHNSPAQRRQQYYDGHAPHTHTHNTHIKAHDILYDGNIIFVYAGEMPVLLARRIYKT